MTPGRRNLTETLWTSRQARRTSLLALCASVLLAACGGDDGGDKQTDTTRPTVAITDSVGGATANGPVTFTFTFSEDVGTSFVTGDVTVTGGTKGAFTKVSATVYTLVVTPTANATGTINVSVAAGAFSDEAGNTSAAAANASQAFDTTVPDTTPPTVVITDSVAGATATGDVTFTFTFSESVGTSFVTGDVTVTGGTKGAFAGSGAVYTLVVTPTANATGTINVNVAAGAFSDVAGNASTAAASASQDYDTRPGAVQVVFADAYAAGVSFVAFGGSVNAVTVDTTQQHTGTSSLKVVVPGGSDYTGGALAAAAPQNLSGFNALTFWIKGSKSATLNVSGIGNDGVGGLKYSAESLQIPVTTTWTQFTIPIPAPARATAVVGLFHFAEGPEDGAYDIFLDDIQYENLPAGAVGAADQANVTWSAVGAATVAVGATAQLNYATNAVIWGAPVTANGGILTNVGWGHFTLTSSDTTKATVDDGGLVTGVAAGPTNISATLAGLAVAGSTTVTVTAGGGGAAFQDITFDSGTVTYTLTDFGGNVGSIVADPTSGSNQVLQVVKGAAGTPSEVWAGTTVSTGPSDTAGKIPFTATAKTMTVRTYSPAAGLPVLLKVEDHTAGAVFAEKQATTTVANGWETLTFDFGSAADPTKTYDRVSIFFNFGVAGTGQTYYADDIKFVPGGGGGGAAPPARPTDPTVSAADVISLFSSTYTGGQAGGDYSGRVDTYHADCFTGPPGAVSVANHTITGTSDVVKRYTMAANTFGVISTIGATGGTATPPDACAGGTQTGANLIDATTMTTIHMDVWSSTGSGNFQIHVVNADGTLTIAGPGAASGATPGSNYASGANTVAAGAWTSFEIALSSLGPPGAPAGLTRVGLVKFFTADAGTYFIDNVYFHK